MNKGIGNEPRTPDLEQQQHQQRDAPLPQQEQPSHGATKAETLPWRPTPQVFRDGKEGGICRANRRQLSVGALVRAGWEATHRRVDAAKPKSGGPDQATPLLTAPISSTRRKLVPGPSPTDTDS